MTLFALCGSLGLASSATMAIHGRGTPIPLDYPRELVVLGPYRVLRNPMVVAGIGQGVAVGLLRRRNPDEPGTDRDRHLTDRGGSPIPCPGRVETTEAEMKRLDRMIAVIVGSILGLGFSSGAAAGDLGWSGTLLRIESDSGTGIYSGGSEGSTPFGGSLHFPNSCGATCTATPFPPEATVYSFSDGAGSIAGIGEVTLGDTSAVLVVDDEVLDEGGVERAALFGFERTMGDTIDTWTVSSSTTTGTPARSIEWGIQYVYITSNPFNDTSFVSTPPASPDVIIWELYEEEGERYAVLGEVDNVPEPGFAAALASGIGALSGFAGRRRRSGRSSTVRA
ncbi:MAG: hypothetical protein IPK00_20700 [Deltaproteobacteria bacterium]|nr:hypothetical protein [Deltaproteobacteria bacterium]